MSAVHIYLSSEASRALEAREGSNRSRTVCQMLERYDEICRRVLPQLSDAEWNAIHDVCNGWFIDTASSIRYLPMEVEDALADGLAERHGIDGEALVRRLEQMSYPELVAVVDAAERYWRGR